MGVCCEFRHDVLDEDTIFKFFFKNLKDEDERKDLRRHVKEFLLEIKPKLKSKINDNDLLKACERNDYIRMVIEKNIQFNNYFKESTTKKSVMFNENSQFSGDGVLYPNLDNLVRAFTER